MGRQVAQPFRMLPGPMTVNKKGFLETYVWGETLMVPTTTRRIWALLLEHRSWFARSQKFRHVRSLADIQRWVYGIGLHVPIIRAFKKMIR